MKKLSKLSLLGEMSLLSKAELKQLVGSRSMQRTCEDQRSRYDCEHLMHQGDWCVAGNNNGYSCVWNGSACYCDPGPYGGITYSYSYSY